MNPSPTLKALGLAEDKEVKNVAAAKKPLMDAVSDLMPDEVFQKTVVEARQAGCYCLTSEDFRQSEHGKANAHVGLFEIHDRPNSKQAPGWWPQTSTSSAAAPLAGLKVVELSRVIAAPAIGKELAELGGE